jgi:hypothetical protein
MRDVAEVIAAPGFLVGRVVERGADTAVHVTSVGDGSADWAGWTVKAGDVVAVRALQGALQGYGLVVASLGDVVARLKEGSR